MARRHETTAASIWMPDGLRRVKLIVKVRTNPHAALMGQFRMLFHCAVVATGFSACTPLPIYHRTGVPVAQMEDDRLNCQVSALRDAPVANQTRQAPPVFKAPRQVCDASGLCKTRSGYWEPGQIYTIDINKDIRTRLETRCMTAQGYRAIDIPQCAPGTRGAGSTTRLPPISEKSCVIKNSDGSFLILDAAT